MGFLPDNFQLAMAFNSRLMAGTGQTEGLTDDGYQRLMPLPYGGGSIISDTLVTAAAATTTITTTTTNNNNSKL